MLCYAMLKKIIKQLHDYHTLLLTAHRIIDLLLKLDGGQLSLSLETIASTTFALTM